MIPEEVNVKESFSLFRSLRRGSHSRAVNAKVTDSVIETNNRWRKLQTTKGKKGLSMSQLYLDIKLVLDCTFPVLYSAESCSYLSMAGELDIGREV